MAPAEYLKKPYGRYVVPESDGTFRAEIIEFPGCIAVGDTAAEALASLEDVAASWLEATIARGQQVPEPIENTAFSGKLVVRLPKSLHKKAVFWAAQDGVSLNQFIVSSIAQQVGYSTAQSRPSAATRPASTPSVVFSGADLSAFGRLWANDMERGYAFRVSSSLLGLIGQSSQAPVAWISQSPQAVTLQSGGPVIPLPVMQRERKHA